MPVILPAQEAEIRRISQDSKTAWANRLSRKSLHKNRAGGVAQGKGPEIKLQYCQKKKEKFILWFTLGIVHPTGFDKCTRVCAHDYKWYHTQ
jgi:hypothetical protein